MPVSNSKDPLEAVRLDIWLNVSCLFKTRSQAQLACQRNRIEVNGSTAKAHRMIRVGDRIEFDQGDWRRVLIVEALQEKSVARSIARTLYDDQSPERPKLDPIQRILRAPPMSREKGKGRPTKRERRETDRLMGE